MNGGCFRCGARASCKHRVVDEPIAPHQVTNQTGRTDLRPFNTGGYGKVARGQGQGYNFGSGEKARMLKDALALFKR